MKKAFNRRTRVGKHENELNSCNEIRMICRMTVTLLCLNCCRNERFKGEKSSVI